MSERLYFICKFQLNGKNRFVVWYTDKTDGLILNSQGFIETFATVDQAHEYAALKGIKIQPEEVENYDFDRITAWCRQPFASQISCDDFLGFWNMLHDVILTVGRKSKFQVIDIKLNAIYDKLFAGANILSQPEIEPYTPTWSLREIRALRRLFTIGLRELHVAVFA